MEIYGKKDSVIHWKNEKTQVFTPELWHLCVLFSVGITTSFSNNFLFSWLYHSQMVLLGCQAMEGFKPGQ